MLLYVNQLHNNSTLQQSIHSTWHITDNVAHLTRTIGGMANSTNHFHVEFNCDQFQTTIIYAG